MNHEIGRIAKLLQDSYGGDPWYGSSIQSVLSGITAQQAATRPLSAAHNIWELVHHMTAWREFTTNKIKGRDGGPFAEYDILNQEQDWPKPKDNADGTWKQSLATLEKSQQALIAQLQEVNDALLPLIVPGRHYSYYTLLHGIVQHDIYHLGQIAILKKSLSHPLGGRFIFS